MSTRNILLRLGVAVVLAASLLFLQACASTDTSAMSAAHEIHSMMPCGMMMESMMGNSHRNHDSDDAHQSYGDLTDDHANSGMN